MSLIAGLIKILALGGSRISGLFSVSSKESDIQEIVG